MCQSISKEVSDLGDLFVETICIADGKALNLRYHNERMNRTRRAFWGDSIEELSLEQWVHPEVEMVYTRCRVVYGKQIEKVEYFPYQIRLVHSLRLVVCDEADYQYKSADRSLLNRLFAERGEMDEVLVVRKGLLTDTSITNIALYDGKVWYTPMTPLLKGTCRQRLLDEKQIRECKIRVEDLHRYQKIRLFNAMIPFGKVELEMSSIR